MKARILGSALAAAMLGLLLSCGGGGGGGASGVGLAASANQALDAGNASTTSGTGAASSTASSAAGDGTGGNGSGSGSGAASSSNSNDSGANATATAGGGDDSGVGSGGTGVSTASAVGIGGVDGFGSIILNDVRYDDSSASLDLQDAPALLIGMTARVAGSVSADFTSGVAQQIVSAVDLRGPVQSIDGAAASFVIMGTTVRTDASTVWGNLSGLSALTPAALVQVWGLPGAPGDFQATRVEISTTAAPVVTGTLQGLSTQSQTFSLGALVVSYAGATLPPATLTNGSIVRVRASIIPSGGPLLATQVQAWYALPSVGNGPVSLAGVVTNFTGLGGFRLLGAPIDASNAQITGGPAGSIGNGVQVVVDGTFSNGIIVASKLKIRKVPGTGGPSSFTVIGTIGDFVSAASFRVRGQPINASSAGVQFINGTSANLGNGTKVTVSGDQVVNGVLLAQQVQFN